MPVDNTRTFVYYIIRKRGNPKEKEIIKMSQNEMISKIEQLREWETLLEEAQSEVEALRDSIKAEMLQEETEELAVGAYIVRWTSVLSNRFDSTAFKKEHAELYKSFTKQVASRRFTIA
jgi:predicted phage-related endonuclease